MIEEKALFLHTVTQKIEVSRNKKLTKRGEKFIEIYFRIEFCHLLMKLCVLALNNVYFLMLASYMKEDLVKTEEVLSKFLLFEI